MNKGLKKKAQTVLERNKFFATTSIAGFGLIQYSNNKLEIAVWYIVILIFSAITIRNVIILTYEYKDQKPIATVSLETWDGYLKDIYISVPIMFPVLYSNESHYFRNGANRSLGSALDEALTEMDSKEKLIGENAHWPYVLIPLIAHYTTVMDALQFGGNETDYEGEYLNDANYTSATEDYQYVGDETDYESEYSEESDEYSGEDAKDRFERLDNYIAKLLGHCNRLNVSNNQIMDKWFHFVINKTFEIINDSVESDNDSDVLPFYKLKFTDFNLDVIGASREGFPVYRMGFQLASKFQVVPDDVWFFSYGHIIDSLYEKADVFTPDSDFIVDISEWYIDELEKSLNAKPALFLHHDYFAYLENENQMMSIKAGEQTIRQVKTVYTFQTINHNCSKTVPRAKCFSECMSQLFVKTCQCIPRQLQFDENLASHLKPCLQKDYEQCRLGIDTEKGEIYCKGKCPTSCNQTVLSFDHVVVNERPFENESLNFQLSPIYTKHPVFTEIYPQSETAFWAALGGAFDFWIGISVISAVHLIVYLVKQLTYAFRKNTKTGSTVRQLVSGLRSKQMISALTLGMSVREVEQNEWVNMENDSQTITSLVQQMGNMTEKMNNITERMDNMAQLMECMAKQIENSVQEQEKLKSIILELQQK